MGHLLQESIWYENMVDCVDITRGSHDHTNQIGAIHKMMKSGSRLWNLCHITEVTCGKFPWVFWRKGEGEV